MLIFVSSSRSFFCYYNSQYNHKLDNLLKYWKLYLHPLLIRDVIVSYEAFFICKERNRVKQYNICQRSEPSVKEKKNKSILGQLGYLPLDRSLRHVWCRASRCTGSTQSWWRGTCYNTIHCTAYCPLPIATAYYPLPTAYCPHSKLPFAECTLPGVGELVSLELDQGSRLAGGVLKLTHDLIVLGRQATVSMKVTVSPC